MGGVFERFLPLVEFQPKVGHFFRHLLVEVFLFGNVLRQIVKGGRSVNVDEELPVALADGGSPHRHTPEQDFVRRLCVLVAEVRKEVFSIGYGL